MSNNAATLRYIEEQLDSLCQRPEMWGPNLSVELQYLLLLEFWYVTTRPDLERRNPRYVVDKYHAFLRANGHLASRPLSETLGSTEEFVRVLKRFRDQFLAEMQPASPFEDFDLTVAYNLRPHYALSESIISHGLGNVRRVLRAATRSPQARAASGRSGRQIETLTDFEIVDVDVRPRNGIGARVVIPMRQQQPSQSDSNARDEVKAAIGAIVTMAEWAGADTSQLPLDDPEERRWIAWQTMRLLPGADVETMELGGRLVSRPRPITLSSAQRPRLMAVIQQSVRQEPYDEAGTIRALNRDTAVLRFRQDSNGDTLRCWVGSGEVLRLAEHNLSSQVQVKGHKLTITARKQVILIEELIVLTEPSDDDEEEAD